MLLGCLSCVAATAAPESVNDADVSAGLTAMGRSGNVDVQGLTAQGLAQARQRSAAQVSSSFETASRLDQPPRISSMARGIRQAVRKSIFESSVEGYSAVLVECQKSRVTISTTALMRSESQQAHCYRF